MYLLTCRFHTKSKLNSPLFWRTTFFVFRSFMKNSPKSNWWASPACSSTLPIPAKTEWWILYPSPFTLRTRGRAFLLTLQSKLQLQFSSCLGWNSTSIGIWDYAGTVPEMGLTLSESPKSGLPLMLSLAKLKLKGICSWLISWMVSLFFP